MTEVKNPRSEIGIEKRAKGASYLDHRGGWWFRLHVKLVVDARQPDGAKGVAASGDHDGGSSGPASRAARSIFLVVSGHAVVAACDWFTRSFGSIASRL
ncbi:MULTISPECIES: hypothetical protein [Sphingomonadaceae]|uniref:Uncharacterized protein n=1 Tax=Sphingomonas sanxanigenens DSM 19645 = NX02 TaxID=1123269 RepID=A0A0F7JW58_9SPHN|nr:MULTISPECIES: hypothetical protein [Sphingomonadaceae]AKH18873.1 hypothetical protein NX02_p1160 [Sphingomonas sanxanigenens DSM 19645 = NX02]